MSTIYCRIEVLENVEHFNDIIELVQRFSTPKHSLIDKIEYVNATKGKSLKLVTKESRSHKRGKRSKSNKLTNKLHKGKAVTKTVSKQDLPRANTAKIKEKGKRKLPLKPLRKVHVLHLSYFHVFFISNKNVLFKISSLFKHF